jgi:hypothetical protein
LRGRVDFRQLNINSEFNNLEFSPRLSSDGDFGATPFGKTIVCQASGKIY